MTQCESFKLDPVASRLNIINKSPEKLPSIEASPGTNRIFAKTIQYHLYPYCTGQWSFDSSHNSALG